jgi:LacI family transcriptional regulator
VSAEPPGKDPTRPATIYDVAAAAGVAPSTVSRAFSRPGRVNAETAERIRRIAVTLGYRVHPLTGSAPHERTSILALVVSDVTNPFYDEIMGGAEAAAAAAGYTMVVANTRGSEQAEREALERVVPLVDGIVLATTIMSDSTIRMMAKQRPMVVLNRVVSDVASVVTDNAAGMRRAVQHLAELGHHTISYAAGPEASWTDGIRWRAMREAAVQLQLQTRRIGPFEPDVAGGGQAGEELARHPTTAVITYNDRMAIGLIRRLTTLGARIPEEVSVIGFDNIYPAELVTPPLTTVAAPLEVMGTVAVRNLLAIIHGAHPHTRDPAMLPSRLVLRESTAQRSRHRRDLSAVPPRDKSHDN